MLYFHTIDYHAAIKRSNSDTSNDSEDAHYILLGEKKV